MPSIRFESVPVEYLDSLEEKLFEVLRKVVKGGIDMERMVSVIEKAKNECRLYIERSPAYHLSMKLITETLYGTLDGKTLKQQVMDLGYYDIFSKWTSDQWVALLKRCHTICLG